jgi:hypothetical protein
MGREYGGNQPKNQRLSSGRNFVGPQLYDNPNVDVKTSAEWNLDIQLLPEVETSPASFVDIAELKARASEPASEPSRRPAGDVNNSAYDQTDGSNRAGKSRILRGTADPPLNASSGLVSRLDCPINGNPTPCPIVFL